MLALALVSNQNERKRNTGNPAVSRRERADRGENPSIDRRRPHQGDASRSTQSLNHASGSGTIQVRTREVREAMSEATKKKPLRSGKNRKGDEGRHLPSHCPLGRGTEVA